MFLSSFEAKNFDNIRYLAGQVISDPIIDIKRLPGTMAYNYEINHKHIFKLLDFVNTCSFVIVQNKSH